MAQGQGRPLPAAGRLGLPTRFSPCSSLGTRCSSRGSRTSDHQGPRCRADCDRPHGPRPPRDPLARWWSRSRRPHSPACSSVTRSKSQRCSTETSRDAGRARSWSGSPASTTGSSSGRPHPRRQHDGREVEDLFTDDFCVAAVKRAYGSKDFRFNAMRGDPQHRRPVRGALRAQNSARSRSGRSRANSLTASRRTRRTFPPRRSTRSRRSPSRSTRSPA